MALAAVAWIYELAAVVLAALAATVARACQKWLTQIFLGETYV